MINRFLYTCRLTLLVLAGSSERGVSQQQFDIKPDSVFLGQVIIGTVHIDSFTIDEILDTFKVRILMSPSIKLVIPTDYPRFIYPNDFVRTRYSLTPSNEGLRTEKIYVFDTLNPSISDS